MGRLRHTALSSHVLSHIQGYENSCQTDLIKTIRCRHPRMCRVRKRQGTPSRRIVGCYNSKMVRIQKHQPSYDHLSLCYTIIIPAFSHSVKGSWGISSHLSIGCDVNLRPPTQLPRKTQQKEAPFGSLTIPL